MQKAVIKMQKILVLDFGGQYNQLIARRVREQNIYAEIKPYNKATVDHIKAEGYSGIIFTGGPNSVSDPASPHFDPAILDAGIPILGICYGCQLMAYMAGGMVEGAEGSSEYGKIEVYARNSILFNDVPSKSVCWMSHHDYIPHPPKGFSTIAVTDKCPTAAMCFDRAPSWRAVALMVVVCLVSIPAMNAIVKWNDGLHLPQFLSGVEQALRTMEDAAAAMTEKLLAVGTVPMLLFSLLVVAFMAGLSEEMLFRGSLLRIWQLGERTNVHVVIWMVAILFSAVHMQFFGFVPRMLLGAYLGYLLLWTRSLWVPIFAHTLNNGMVVVANFLAARGVIDEEAFDAFGVPAAGQFPWLALLSALLTLALLCMAPRILKPAKNHYSAEE